MQIVKPSLQDIPQLVELWQEQYRLHHTLDSEYYVVCSRQLMGKFKNYLIKAIKTDKPNILVAKEKSKLLGFITFEVGEEKYFDTNIKRYGHVIELFVKKNERGKNIGKKLMQTVENHFAKFKIKYVNLQCSSFNQNALQFYLKIGYSNRQILLYKAI